MPFSMKWFSSTSSTGFLTHNTYFSAMLHTVLFKQRKFQQQISNIKRQASCACQQCTAELLLNLDGNSCHIKNTLFSLQNKIHQLKQLRNHESKYYDNFPRLVDFKC